MKKTTILLLCFTLLLSVLSSFNIATAETVDKFEPKDEELYNEAFKVITNNMRTDKNNNIDFDIEKIKSELPENKKLDEIISEIKKVDNKVTVDPQNSYEVTNNLNKSISYSARTTATTRPDACGIQGKKRNPTFWNGYNKCIESKLKSEYNIGAAVTGMVTAIIAGDFQKGFWLGVKNGLKGNIAGFMVTASIIQYQCHKKWDKYPACIKK